jgi:Protein phosphatase 2C
MGLRVHAFSHMPCRRACPTRWKASLRLGRLQVSGNHRLDDCKAERERVLAAGSAVARSRDNGEEVGPLRVWPGGLAMSRSIGDAAAGDAVTAVPDVLQV